MARCCRQLSTRYRAPRLQGAFHSSVSSKARTNDGAMSTSRAHES